MTFFPSNLGVRDIRNNRGDCGSDEVGEPEKVAAFDEEIRDNSEECIVEKRDSEADEKVSGSMLGGFDVIGAFGVLVCDVTDVI